MPGLERRIALTRPLDLSRTVGVLRHGAGDPSAKVLHGRWWFGQATPEGDATVSLAMADRECVATAWGPGAGWALEAARDLIGEGDDDSDFVAHHPQAATGRRQLLGWRVTRSRLVTQSLIPAIIEQKVTGKEAFAGHARLIRRFGRPAPGPAAQWGLRVPPAPREWAQIPSWEWLRSGIDGARAATAVRASQYAGRVEECADLSLAQAHRRLRGIPGVGEWTAAEVAQRALGDPDSASFGDYHLAKNLTWALTGTVGDDDLARELLAPYVGHRYRAAVYITAAAGDRPRRGPRFTLPTHLPGGPGVQRG